MIAFKPLPPRLVKWLKRIAAALLAVILAFWIFYLSVLWGAFGPMPKGDDLRSIRNYLASEVYSTDDILIGKYFIENRTGAGFDELPEVLIDALVATEDARFFEHRGVDRRSLIRVIFKTILLGDRSSGGGSTITQQLVKNTYGRKDYGIFSMPVAKLREAIIARRMEKVLSKEQILELYLNTVSFGESVYGIETASQRYFNKLPAELNVEESAVLIGLLKANTLYNPRKNPDEALHRRNTVLTQMARYGYMEEELSDSLQSLPLDINYYNLETENPAPYFISHIRREILDILDTLEKPDGSKYDLETDGLRIQTTLDSELQAEAVASVWKHMKKLNEEFRRHWGNRNPWGTHSNVIEDQLVKSRTYLRLKEQGLTREKIITEMSIPQTMAVVDLSAESGISQVEMSPLDSIAYYQSMLHAGFVAMDPGNGEVKAWVGGVDFQYLPYDHVTTLRQTASTFKPFVYGAAVESGIDPCTYFQNIHRTYPDFDDWTPTNSNGDDSLYYNLRGGLKHSLNVITVEVMFEAGREKVRDFAHKLGILSPVKTVPSMALGTNEATLFEMVSAYGVFANGGNSIEPVFVTSITDAFGEVIYKAHEAEPIELLDSSVAHTMDNLLQAVINEGTGSSVRTVYRLKSKYGGKTGTTQNYSDGWFIGYSPTLVAGAWVGASSPEVHFRSGNLGSGAHMALPIWAQFFQSIEQKGNLRAYRETEPVEVPDQAMVPCPDVREPNFIERIGRWFDSGERRIDTTTDKKRNFWDKLFNR